ncbi:hypothetical protein KBC04_02305 [Candidatus Babeliales bacterium]|nr:hypothetical protein [Candidatus Babeliales bacterium]MBP9843758.1 hypothetical protein [Candidatus Babeliales bacterium]
MKFNKNIVVSLFYIMVVTQIYSSDQLYEFGIGEITVENGVLSGCQNPRYVDRALLAIDEQVLLLENQKNKANAEIVEIQQYLLYKINLPIYRYKDFHEYPSYQTFSRMMTDPMIMSITTITAAIVYFTIQGLYPKDRTKKRITRKQRIAKNNETSKG